MKKYVIQVQDRLGKSSMLPLGRFPFNIGRHPDNDLVIADASVSKKHAYIRETPQGLEIVDNGSLNGVSVNGERIDHKRLLRVGDTVVVCSSRFTVKALETPEITLAQKHGEGTTFFPAQGDWDPSQALKAGFLPMGKHEAPKRGPGIQAMLKLLLEVPHPETYEQILNVVEEAVHFDRCYLVLFDNEYPDRINVVAKRAHKHLGSEVMVSKGVLQRVEQSSEAVIVKPEETGYSQRQSFINTGASTALCIPLIANRRVIGVIYLDRMRSAEEYSPADVEALGPLAGIAALKIENLRLINSQIASEISVRDMNLAKQIQEGLLPRDKISFPGYWVDGYSCPCQQIGGDYFDFFCEEGENLTLVIGDVSGKGIPSALYMACVRSALHAHLADGLDMDVLMSRLETHTQKAFRADHFLTLFLGKLAAKTGVLTYSNAGHLPPVVLKAAGNLVQLDVTDPALNLVPCATFHCQQYLLEPGDLFALYTDGITEAENAAREQFGLERLIASLRQKQEKELSLIRKEILAEVDAFAGESGPGDDRTLVLIRRIAGG